MGKLNLVKYYVRRMYHMEKLGPFDSVEEAEEFILEEIRKDFYWGYDPVSIGEWDEYPQGIIRRVNT